MTLESSGVPQDGAAKRVRRADRGLPADPKEALEQMLLNAHRLAVALGDLGVFRHSELSVAEWAIMKVLDGRQDVPLKQISASSAVSRQRLRKLVSELEQKGLVVAGKSTGDDKRVRMISATPTAAQVLSLISRQMQELIPEAAKSGRHRSLGLAARSMEQVARTIRRNWQGRSSKSSKADSDGNPAATARLARAG
jgi:DNA-binding MarR family transcriptional regulator